MKKIGLVVLLLAALVAVVAQPVYAGGPWGYELDAGIYRHQAMHSRYPSGYGYSPGMGVRDAQRAYWDDDLIDSVGKVITLPFTLPMRVGGEWNRLSAKAKHWGKAGEAYKSLPPDVGEADLQKEMLRLQGEILRLQKELKERSSQPGP